MTLWRIGIMCMLFAINTAHAVPTDSERIAILEQKVQKLTEQINFLLHERAQNAPTQTAGEVHACEISVFSQQFRAENANRGRARLDVLKQCLQKYNHMFCENKDVRCETFR